MSGLFVPRRAPTILGPLAGFVVSVLLHALTGVAVLVIASSHPNVPDSPRQETTIAITYLAPPHESPPAWDEERLLEGRDAAGGESGTGEDLQLAGFSVDLARIRARRHVPFPFLTLDRAFLESIPGRVRWTRSRLANPYGAPAGTPHDLLSP